MKQERKLDDCYRILIPVEFRNKLDINKYEPIELELDEDTKKLTVTFKKYENEIPSVQTKIYNDPVGELELSPELEHYTLSVRKRNLVTIPREVFAKFHLKEQRYNVSYITGKEHIALIFHLNKDGEYKYRKENVLSFAPLNEVYDINIHEGVEVDLEPNFTCMSISFLFKKEDILIDDSKEEVSETKVSTPVKMNITKIEKEEPKIDIEDEDNYIEEYEEPEEVKKEINNYREQLPKFKPRDEISFKSLQDQLSPKPCPRCGSLVIGDNTIKLNGKVLCEECTTDLKVQTVLDIQRNKLKL